MKKYMKVTVHRLKYLFLIFIGLFVRGLYAQEPFNQDPGNPNMDFSEGNFNHWELSWIKRDEPDNVHEGPASVSSPVLVGVYGNNWDGNAGTGNLPRVPSGLERVARFGDPAGSGLGNSRAYKLQYYVTVNADFPMLYVQLASLMDNSHGTDGNTHYKFSLKDVYGSVIPIAPCTSLELYPQNKTETIAGSTPLLDNPYQLKINPSGNYHYQPWESIAIDLSEYIGQTIALEFEHFDCSYGVHGSYTYLSAGMRKKTETIYYCKGATVEIVPYNPRFKSYLWNTGETTESIVIDNPEDGAVYSYTVNSYNGCSATFSYVLEEIAVNLTFTHSDGTECNQLLFKDTTVSDEHNIVSWEWNFGDPASDSNSSTEQNPVHSFTNPGSYTVTLTVTNEMGCTNTVTQHITVGAAPVPKGISPNGDGLNDVLNLECMNTETMTIFNRYGKKVYSKNNYKNEWYGQSNNGKSLPAGTYFYIIKLSNGQILNGYIQLIHEIR